MFLMGCIDDRVPNPANYDVIDRRSKPVLLSKEDTCVMVSTLVCEKVVDECGFISQTERGDCEAIGQSICLSNDADPREFWQDCRSEIWHLSCEDIDTDGQWWYTLCVGE